LVVRHLADDELFELEFGQLIAYGFEL
jgi:hypothetical protein